MKKAIVPSIPSGPAITEIRGETAMCLCHGLYLGVSHGQGVVIRRADPPAEKPPKD